MARVAFHSIAQWASQSSSWHIHPAELFLATGVFAPLRDPPHPWLSTEARPIVRTSANVWYAAGRISLIVLIVLLTLVFGCSGPKSATGAEAPRFKSRTAYQDFLTLWKDADPDIPILKQVKAEYAKL